MWFLKWLGLALAIFVGLSKIALGGALDPWATWASDQPYVSKQIPPVALIARGAGTDAYYVMEVDPSTGALPVSLSGGISAIDVHITGGAYADSVRNVYSSTNVTASAWVQLIASTAAVINCVTVFDSSGQTLKLGTGGSGSETIALIVPPGGLGGCIPLHIAAGTRLSIRAISGTASTGELDITGLQ